MGKDKDKKKEKVYNAGTLPEITVTPRFVGISKDNMKDYKAMLKKSGNGKPRDMSGFGAAVGKKANEAARIAIEKHLAKDLSKAAKTALHNPPRL